jgi:hypothetical protein
MEQNNRKPTPTTKETTMTTQTTRNLSGLSVPDLDHDYMMAERFGHTVSVNGRFERRAVWALCHHMEERGWSVHTVYDGEEETHVATPKDAMELIFNLDEASLRFYRTGHDATKWHGVLLILGNGEDIISDWNYSKGDPDGFNAAMEAFDVSRVL